MTKFFLILCLFPFFSWGIEEKPFVILIPSYNNEAFCSFNLVSALRQQYSNYRIVYVNDCSTDGTLNLVKQIVEKEGKEHLVTIIDNKERRLALGNIYHAIHEEIEDDEIVICLDGDDALANKSVLSFLNIIYSNSYPEVWLTYGQFAEMNSKNLGWVARIPNDVVSNNAFRTFTHIPSHLRTFYAWLFKLIDVDDLLYQGNFFEMSWDMAMMFPMIEMARDHFQFISKVLYIYNDRNPISDHVKNKCLQRELDLVIRARPPYTPLDRRP